MESLPLSQQHLGRKLPPIAVLLILLPQPSFQLLYCFICLHHRVINAHVTVSRTPSLGMPYMGKMRHLCLKLIVEILVLQIELGLPAVEFF